MGLFKSKIKSLLISPIFPTILMGVVTVIRVLSDSITPIQWAMSIVFLLIWIIIRWSLEHELNLIKEYKPLMKPLGELSRKNSNCSMRIFFHAELQNKNLLKCWRDYYNLKSEDIDTHFNNLNAELDKVISNPYLLLNKNKSSSITKKFRYIAKETETLYDKFNNIVIDEKIPLDNSMIKKTFENFIHALNLSRNEFPEIENEFINGYFNPFEEPKQ